MAIKTARVSLFSDNSFEGLIFNDPPKRVLDVYGWIVSWGDSQHPIIVRHDPYWHPRTQDLTISITNETRPLWEYIPNEDRWVKGKVVLPLYQRKEWILRNIELMGMTVWKRFISPGDGFCDTTEAGVDPVDGEIKIGMIDAGGNRRNALKDLGDAWLIQTQNFYGSPDANIDYFSAPHLMVIKVLIGNTPDIPWFIKPDPKQGDTILNLAARVPLVHEKQYVEEYPELPFFTRMHNYPVMITKYCFHGSDTYGWVEGSEELEDGWYTIEEMVYPDHPDTNYQANDRSRVIHVDPKDWVETCPPPYDGWTRTESFWDKLLSYFNVLSAI